MSSESSGTITVKEDIKETVINPSSNGYDGRNLGIYMPAKNVTQPVIPVNVITNVDEKKEIKIELPTELSHITVNEEDDMSIVIEEVVNTIVNKAVEKMNDDFISHLDNITLDMSVLKDKMKALQIDSSHQAEFNIEVNKQLMFLKNKEDKIIDIDTCIITKIKSILLSFINKK